MCFNEEELALMKNREWEEEKRQKGIIKEIQEKERRDMIRKKRENEKEEFYRRLEESKQKFVDAQNNLEQVIGKQKIEKKVSFNYLVSTKVDLSNLKMELLNVISQVIHTEEDVEEVADKRRKVQHALEEMERREEEFKVLHERDQQMREEQATKRKEDMEQQIKGTILSSNR